MAVSLFSIGCAFYSIILVGVGVAIGMGIGIVIGKRKGKAMQGFPVELNKAAEQQKGEAK
jgi:uncharacterized membrane protein